MAVLEEQIGQTVCSLCPWMLDLARGQKQELQEDEQGSSEQLPS